MKWKILLLILLPLKVLAQQDKESFFREPSFGIMLTFLASHNFSGLRPDTTQWTFAPAFNILTPKTHDHIMFDCGSKSWETLNGWLLKKNWDIYNFLEKSLLKKDAYGSVGIEKVVTLPENVDIVFFAEVGTNFSGTTSTTIGTVFHPQLSLKKKTKN